MSTGLLVSLWLKNRKTSITVTIFILNWWLLNGLAISLRDKHVLRLVGVTLEKGTDSSWGTLITV